MPFIIFEGIDGSGTTTQSKRLVEKLSDVGRDTLWTCEPTTGFVGKFVREVFEKKHGPWPSWRVMLHLFQADREMHYQVIRKWLKEHPGGPTVEMSKMRGGFVVSDRSWLSSMAYQVTSAVEADEGDDEDEVGELIERLNEHAPVADMTFILDVPVKEALVRLGKTDPDHYEQADFLEEVRKHYLDIDGRGVRRIDTSGRTVDEVAEEIDKKMREAGY